LLERPTGRLVCVECKTELEAEDPEIRAKHTAIGLELTRVGIDFIVTTDTDLACEASRLNSRDLVRGIRTPFTREVDAALRKQIANVQPATYGALVHLVGSNCALVALSRGMTYFDTHQRLTPDVALGIFEEHFDAAYVIFRKSTHRFI
jgi:hypothetical protein